MGTCIDCGERGGFQHPQWPADIACANCALDVCETLVLEAVENLENVCNDTGKSSEVLVACKSVI